MKSEQEASCEMTHLDMVQVNHLFGDCMFLF